MEQDNKPSGTEKMSKAERRAYLEMVDHEFSPRDGYWDIACGFLLLIWSLYGLWLITEGKNFNPGVAVLTMIVLPGFILSWVRLKTIQRKYPDIGYKDLNSDAFTKQQIVVIPVFFAILMMGLVLWKAGISLPHHLGLHLLMFLGYSTVGAAFLCVLAIQYSSPRLTLWAVLCPLISITMVVYPNNWTRLYLKGGGLGLIMLVTGLIVHLRFVRTLPPRVKQA